MINALFGTLRNEASGIVKDTNSNNKKLNDSWKDVSARISLGSIAPGYFGDEGPVKFLSLRVLSPIRNLEIFDPKVYPMKNSILTGYKN